MQKLDNDTIQYLKYVLILSEEEINDVLLRIQNQERLNQTQVCTIMCELDLIENEYVGQRLIEETSEAESFDVKQLFEIYSRLKAINQELEYEISISKIADAFVALGGNPDHSGSIPKSFFLKVLQSEFQFEFDIDFALLEIQGDDLKFPEFLTILKKIGIDGQQFLFALQKQHI